MGILEIYMFGAGVYCTNDATNYKDFWEDWDDWPKLGNIKYKIGHHPNV